MPHFSLADPQYFAEHSPPVKTEASASPDLLSSGIASIHQYPFKFHHAPPSSSSHGSLPSPRHPSEPPSLTQSQIYRFGSGSSYNIMSNHTSWTPSPSSSHHMSSTSSRVGHGNGKFDLMSNQNTVTYPDDYDDAELVEIPEGSHPGDLAMESSTNGSGKHIRRRSSKACTFLGPSRKRGPPKGYIDAIEARLHQTEALLGIMLSSNDSRAQSLLRDIGKDPLAREIIKRVDSTPYGVKGRKRDGDVKPRAGHQASSTSSEASLPGSRAESEKFDLATTHPSNEWQDRVSAMLAALSNDSQATASEDFHHREKSSATVHAASYADSRPSLRVNPSNTVISLDEHDDLKSPGRRTRRRLDTDDVILDYPARPQDSAHGSSASQRSNSIVNGSKRRWSVGSVDSVSGSGEDLNGAVGQLSLNEEEQLRYHGKASGLHLLGNRERVDGRNEGGIWRFPKARVWPPLASSSSVPPTDEDEYVSRLPDQSVQEHLVELYFKHVHTYLPVIHKRAFYDAFRAGPDSSPQSSTSASPFNRPRRGVPSLLLFAMFAIAARYDDAPKPSDSTTMWEAGDEYLNHAKGILDDIYSASRPSTCQALLLMGYREIGIGAMAQAWTYIGMAIRMAQDLGMHRSADKWARERLGGRLFSDWELHERKRIWYASVIMDVYVSTYIGRPLMISEKDYDTPLPSQDDPEENENWTPSIVLEGTEMPAPVSARTISCFNASARLAGILGMIVQGIYAIRPDTSRQSEAKYLEGVLDQWYIALPENLRYDVGSTKRPIPPPQVLTLHLQYWCTVLLLHRPFIRNPSQTKNKDSQGFDDVDAKALSDKSYQLGTAAANHISTIVTAHPGDPQARINLNKCKDVLRQMEVIWPSAARALELLSGSKDNTEASDNALSMTSTERRKRPAEQALNDTTTFHRSVPADHATHDYLELRAPYTNHYDSHGVYTTSNHEISSHTSTGHFSYLPSSSCDRWPSDNTQSFGLPGSLSTSALPQLYSTGFTDNRSGGGHRSHTHTHHAEQPRASHTQGRHAQYWSDFSSSFPQLGTTYGGYHEPSSVSQQPQHHPTSSHLYLTDTYSLYSECFHQLGPIS
ncbi:hypothetical protein H0H92_000574 [Tricholoma furcatifolium]|nr:hypothetical protein H0H92_000574 [Tricholoma furcatifolium]